MSDQLLAAMFFRESNTEERVNFSPYHCFKIELRFTLPGSTY